MRKEKSTLERHEPGNASLAAVMRCLRLGNTISYNSHFVVVQGIINDCVSVSGIEKNRFTPIKFDDELLSFIPITRDALEECKFKKIDFNHDTFCWELKNFKITDSPTTVLDEDGRYIETDLINREYFFYEKQIFYLHELQNIAIDLHDFVLNIA